MVRRFALAALTASLFVVTCCIPAAAAEGPKSKGLLITPVREYLDVKSGNTADGSFTVANLTDKPMTVSFSVQAFEVADYTYDYRFNPPKNDWVRIALDEITLVPSKSKKVAYSATVPQDAPPGGQYYTLFATTTQQGDGVTTQVRATDLLYLTVAGELTRTSEVGGNKFPRVVFGGSIPFSIDVKNTGNIHYFAHLNAKLDGLFTKDSAASSSHLLMPGTSRTLSNNIKSPLLPGIYRAHLGYQVDNGQGEEVTSLVIYVPPWSIIFFGGLVWLMVILARRIPWHRLKKPKHKED